MLSAGSAIIVTALTYFGKIFQHGFHLKGVVPSIEAINGQAMNTLGLGNEIALTFLGIFIVNIIIARVSPWKYIFLTGQALLWMSTMTVVGGKMAGLNAVMTIIARDRPTVRSQDYQRRCDCAWALLYGRLHGRSRSSMAFR